jgi:hypothetical protein
MKSGAGSPDIASATGGDVSSVPRVGLGSGETATPPGVGLGSGELGTLAAGEIDASKVGWTADATAGDVDVARSETAVDVPGLEVEAISCEDPGVIRSTTAAGVAGEEQATRKIRLIVTTSIHMVAVNCVIGVHFIGQPHPQPAWCARGQLYYKPDHMATSCRRLA